MKKVIMLFMCLTLLVGCAPSEHDLEKEAELEADIDEIKKEMYEQAYEEGYRDAIEAMFDKMPLYLVDYEELEDSLDIIFDGDEYADELRDQILSYCELYECVDFRIEYSDEAMDYDY